MNRVSKLFFPVALCALVLLNAQAQTGRNVHVDFKETTLKNGLRVITVEDHTAPVVAISITYNVGSRNERQGRTGFAHLFEHMMFKGSENIGSGEHFLLVFRRFAITATPQIALLQHRAGVFGQRDLLVAKIVGQGCSRQQVGTGQS